MIGRSLVLVVACAALLEPALAQEDAYGAELTVAKATKVSDILAKPEAFDGKRVLVEGEVTKVCQNMGCWIEIAGETEGSTIRFKVDDGDIVFPKEAAGRKARAEGIVEVKTLSVEDQVKQGEHHAEESGEAFDRSSVKGPLVRVRILGEGATLR